MRELINITAMLACFALISIVSIWWVVPAVARVTFDHGFHQSQVAEQDCSTCHLAGAQKVIPDEAVCLQCHKGSFVENVVIPTPKTHGPLWGFNHRSFAKGAEANCAECHQQSECLECHQAGFADEMGAFGNNLDNVHRSDFQVSHPIAARTDPQLCISCHENSFCVDCHNTFAPSDLALDSHRRGWSDITVAGASHANFSENSCESCHQNSVLPSHEWSARHSREARKNLMTCQACHPEGDVCLQCHGTVSGLKINPHPADWDDFSERLERASGGKTCRKCH